VIGAKIVKMHIEKRTIALLGSDERVERLRRAVVGLVGYENSVLGHAVLHLIRSGAAKIMVCKSDDCDEDPRPEVRCLASDVSVRADDIAAKRTRVECLQLRAREVAPGVVDVVEYTCLAEMLTQTVLPSVIAVCYSADAITAARMSCCIAERGILCLTVANCSAVDDATTLRVSSPSDAAIDDVSARQIRRGLLRADVRTRVGIIHGSSRLVAGNQVADNARISVTASLGAIVASQIMGCVTDAFEQPWRTSSSSVSKLGKLYREAVLHLRRISKNGSTSETNASTNIDDDDDDDDDDDGDDRKDNADPNTTVTALPSVTSIEYIIDCLWENRSAYSRRSFVPLVLERWNFSGVSKRHVCLY
jgi:hypothetical protein